MREKLPLIPTKAGSHHRIPTQFEMHEMDTHFCGYERNYYV